MAPPGRPTLNLQPSPNTNRLQLSNTNYDAADNLAQLDLDTKQHEYARGLGSEVLCVYDLVDDNFTWARDHDHRGAQPLATVDRSILPD